MLLGPLQIAAKLMQPPQIDVRIGILRIDRNSPLVGFRSAFRIDVLQIKAQVVPVVAVEPVDLFCFDQVALRQRSNVTCQIADREVEPALTGFGIPE